MTEQAMKRCSKCGETYPATHEFFGKHHKRADGSLGLNAKCKTCNSAIQRQRWADERGGVIQTLRKIIVTGLPGGELEVELTRGFKTVIDTVDQDLSEVRWCASSNEWSEYALRTVKRNRKNTTKYLHCEILERILGRELEQDELCDHKDGNTLNNRRSNLRLADHAGNSRNRRLDKRNKSGYTGVFEVRPGKWAAHLSVSGKLKHLGTYDTPELASEAYKQGAVKYFGEFAREKPQGVLIVPKAVEQTGEVAI